MPVPADLHALVASPAAGFGLDQPERHAEPALLARLAGEGLADLHRVALGTAGDGSSGGDPERAWQAVVDRCVAAVDSGQVVAEHLAQPYARYQPERLLEMVSESTAGWSTDVPPVWCHGRPTPEVFRVDQGRFLGFDRLDSAVIADRHLDLAVAHWGIDRVLGAEAVYGFYEGYGQDPDLLRLDHYLLVAHLLGLVSTNDETRTGG